ncbi:hypothetical protein VPH35_077756 [Triticum aestivum]
MKAKAGSRTNDSLATGGWMKAKAGSRTGDSLAAGGRMKAKACGEEEQGRQGPQQAQVPPKRHLRLHRDTLRKEYKDKHPTSSKAGGEKWKSLSDVVSCSLEGESMQGTS